MAIVCERILANIHTQAVSCLGFSHQKRQMIFGFKGLTTIYIYLNVTSEYFYLNVTFEFVDYIVDNICRRRVDGI